MAPTLSRWCSPSDAPGAIYVVGYAGAEWWVNEWTATQEVCQAAGACAEAAGHTVSAIAYYRRAATYYATALYRVSGTTERSSEREIALWRRQRGCWDRVVDLQPVPGERIAIPYEDTTLAGFFFRAPDASPASHGRSS
jgi:hypothetical protein